MRIKKLRLQNFKRFDDLIIDMSALESVPKLVLLVGANGSGKSSVFDAFEALSGPLKDVDASAGNDYYRKDQEQEYLIDVDFDNGETVQRTEMATVSHNNWLHANAFYGRSSLRHIPTLDRKSLGPETVDPAGDSDRPRKYIERETRFENDIEKIAEAIVKDIFQQDLDSRAIKTRYINPINEALERIFGGQETTQLRLVSIIPPLDGNVTQITFRKGSAQYHYNLLSSGEKEIINLLFNLHSRRQYFQDTVYFMDEIDLHLEYHTQKRLLKEITENWIPANCQLWTASHSLGFMEYANENADAVTIDFDQLNFDQQQILRPIEKENFEVFNLAVSEELLARLLSGKKIVFCENTDAPHYNGLELLQTVFVSAQNKDAVFYKSLEEGFHGLIDRDYLTNEEREEIMELYDDLVILGYYSIENYFFHPDNLEEWHTEQGKAFDKRAYIEGIRAARDNGKMQIALKIKDARNRYRFFSEPANQERQRTFRSNEQAVADLLQSDDFESFYKVFPAKDYGTQLPERQGIPKAELASTNWFRTQIENLLTPSNQDT